MEKLVILGHIDIPSHVRKNKAIYCDDCGCITNSSWGDVRHKITTIYHDGTTSVKRICDNCSFEWEDAFNSEPKSIFE